MIYLLQATHPIRKRSSELSEKSDYLPYAPEPGSHLGSLWNSYCECLFIFIIQIGRCRIPRVLVVYRMMFNRILSEEIESDNGDLLTLSKVWEIILANRCRKAFAKVIVSILKVLSRSR